MYWIRGLLAITLFLSSYCYGKIVEVKTMEGVFEQFKGADQTTLGVFDIDMVLIQPADAAFQLPNMERYPHLKQRFLKGLSEDELLYMISMANVRSASILVDSQTPHYLKQVHDQGVSCIALTANLIGPLAEIPDLASWKIERLKSVGIDFSQLASQVADRSLPVISVQFKNLPSYHGYSPCYQQGVLFANTGFCPKGDVLVAFLKENQLTPKQIIFVDDRLDNLKHTEAALACYAPEITYIGCHYLGADSYPSALVEEAELERRWNNLLLEVRSILAHLPSQPIPTAVLP